MPMWPGELLNLHTEAVSILALPGYIMMMTACLDINGNNEKILINDITSIITKIETPKNIMLQLTHQSLCIAQSILFSFKNYNI